MALYSLAQRTSNTTIANASWEIRSASTDKTKILQIEVSQNTAVAGVYGIGRPAVIGTTPTTPQTFVDEGDGNGPAAVTVAAVAWAVGPVIPINFNRRYSLSATVGLGFVVGFPDGLKLPISSSLVIWNIATAAVIDASAVIDE